MRFPPKWLASIVWVMAFMLPAAQIRADAGVGLVRDAEIEHDIRVFVAPIFKAAGLDADGVNIYLVNDKTINAFVAEGQNVFVNTGLIMATDQPGQLIGVVAHETGHIAGGHLARFDQGMKGASALMMLSMVLGAAAMAAGSGDAGMGILMGGQDAAYHAVMGYSRTQESSADQAGLKFLTETQQSGRGMVEFFEKLEGQEMLMPKDQDPFMRSHPLTRDRIDALQRAVDASPFADKPQPPEFIEMHKRIVAKLRGFIQPLDATLRQYPKDDASLYARYARAIAFHQAQRHDRAMTEIDGLIKDYPNDPYFHELRAQILFEDGKVADSIPDGRLAAKLLPGEPLLQVSLAQELIATDDPKYNQEALEHLETSLRRDTQNPMAWHQAAIAYDRAGKPGLARWATAERYMLTGDMQAAVMHADAAQKILPRGSPQWLRAQDISVMAGAELRKRDKKRS